MNVEIKTPLKMATGTAPAGAVVELDDAEAKELIACGAAAKTAEDATWPAKPVPKGGARKD
jgi:hypothetical protein